MSRANVSTDVPSSQPSIHVAQSLDTPSTSSAPSVISNDYSIATTSTLQSSVGHPPTHSDVSGSGAQVVPLIGRRKGKKRLVADQRIINKASERLYFLTFTGLSGGRLTLLFLSAHNRVASLLVADHLSVVFPDVDTPFSDTEDVIRRLLPYHVLQQPAKDLQEVISDPSGKGKGRAIHDNGVDIEGAMLDCTWFLLIAQGHHRHQTGNRIS